MYVTCHILLSEIMTSSPCGRLLLKCWYQGAPQRIQPGPKSSQVSEPSKKIQLDFSSTFGIQLKNHLRSVTHGQE